MVESDFIVVARQLAEEPLVFRFNTFRLAQAMFLEAFATKWLVRLLSFGNYPRITPIPYEKADFEDRIRHHFHPALADAVLEARPSQDSPAFEPWLKMHTPENVAWQDFRTFLLLCDTAITRWKIRRAHEVHTIVGAQIIAFLLAHGIQILFVITVYLRGFQLDEIVIMVVAVLLAGIVCARSRAKSLD